MGNSNKITYLKLKKKDGQDFINNIKYNFKYKQVINQKFKILHEKDSILFPIFENKVLLDNITIKLLNQIDFEILHRDGINNEKYKYQTLEEALEGKIPHQYFGLIPKSYDIIGNIAVIEFNKNYNINDNKFKDYKKKIAIALKKVNNNVKTVYEKKSRIKGKYRIRNFALLCGENKSETTHKENGCVFKLDIKKTYFSPRLVFERRRITSSDIKKNEIIIDMFTGVGTFSIQIAKKYNVQIHAFDLNPYAIKFLKHNIKINKLKGYITPYHMNVKHILNPMNNLGTSLSHRADRIIMNLPEKSIDFIDISCYLMKNSGGILHFYKISDKPNPVDKTIKHLEVNLSKFNWNIVKILNSRIVKSYSPSSELVVVDLKVKALNY